MNTNTIEGITIIQPSVNEKADEYRDSEGD